MNIGDKVKIMKIYGDDIKDVLFGESGKIISLSKTADGYVNAEVKVGNITRIYEESDLIPEDTPIQLDEPAKPEDIPKEPARHERRFMPEQTADPKEAAARLEALRRHQKDWLQEIKAIGTRGIPEDLALTYEQAFATIQILDTMEVLIISGGRQ